MISFRHTDRLIQQEFTGVFTSSKYLEYNFAFPLHEHYIFENRDLQVWYVRDKKYLRLVKASIKPLRRTCEIAFRVMGSASWGRKDSHLPGGGGGTKFSFTAESHRGENVQCCHLHYLAHTLRVCFLVKACTVFPISQVNRISSPGRNKGDDGHLSSTWHLLVPRKAPLSNLTFKTNL